MILSEKPTLFFQVTSGVSFLKLYSSHYSLTSPGLISKMKTYTSLPAAVTNFPVYRTTALSPGHSALHSPAVAGNGPCFQVPVGERVNSGTEPLTFPLVHGVKNVNNLITFHWEGAAVQLAGDVQIQADMERVPRCDQPFFQLWQQFAITCSSEGRGEARSLLVRPQHAASLSILWEKCTTQTSEAPARGGLYFQSTSYTSYNEVMGLHLKALMGHWFRNGSQCWSQKLWEYSHYNDTFRLLCFQYSTHDLWNSKLLSKGADTAIALSCNYSLSSATNINDTLFPLLLALIGTPTIYNVLYLQLSGAQKTLQ